MEICKDNINIYRTDRYIVEQTISLNNTANRSIICSYDVYYLRNKHRDKKYNQLYGARKEVDGKRVHSTMYTRKYVK